MHARKKSRARFHLNFVTIPVSELTLKWKFCVMDFIYIQTDVTRQMLIEKDIHKSYYLFFHLHR